MIVFKNIFLNRGGKLRFGSGAFNSRSRISTGKIVSRRLTSINLDVNIFFLILINACRLSAIEVNYFTRKSALQRGLVF